MLASTGRPGVVLPSALIRRALAAAALVASLTTAGAAQSVGAAAAPGAGRRDPAATAGGQPGCRPKLDSRGQPKYVAIIVGGIGSYTAGGRYDPLDVTDYCMTHHGGSAWVLPKAPAPVVSALDYFVPHPTVQTSLTNTLAESGAVILPFSYVGATLAKSGTAPWMTVSTSSVSEPGDVLPPQAAAAMQREVASVRAEWPDARIVIAGHSEGGLVAETWWLRYGREEMPAGQADPGVVGVFSLDSPVNGLPTGGTCALEKGLAADLSGAALGILAYLFVKNKIGSLCQLAHVGAALGKYYAHLWSVAAGSDPATARLTAAEHDMYVPIGSEYDPVYYLLGVERASDHHGLASQVLYDWSGGAPTGPALVPSYFTSCYAGTGVTFSSIENNILNLKAFGRALGLIGKNFIFAHGVVINCPSTSVYVLHRMLGDDGGWFTSIPPPPPPPPVVVHPGTGSPAAAVEGFMSDLIGGNPASGCQYTNQVSSCVTSLSGQLATGSFTIHQTVRQGSGALVAVTGKICVNGACQSNSDPGSGMPGGSVTFNKAYAAAMTTPELSPVDCVEVSGEWLVNLGPGIP